jgi:hypothetical protein
MVQQILRIAGELAIRVEGEASAKRLGSALVQRPRVGQRIGRTTAPDLVRGELGAPAERVPEAGIAATERDGALDQRETISVLCAPRDEQGRQVLERFDVIGVERERAPRQGNGFRDVMRRMTLAGLREEGACLCLGGRQWMPSTSASASLSVKARNEFVRTLPWPLTASDTRVIVSSSGASAMTT